MFVCHGSAPSHSFDFTCHLPMLWCRSGARPAVPTCCQFSLPIDPTCALSKPPPGRCICLCCFIWFRPVIVSPLPVLILHRRSFFGNASSPWICSSSSAPLDFVPCCLAGTAARLNIQSECAIVTLQKKTGRCKIRYSTQELAASHSSDKIDKETITYQPEICGGFLWFLKRSLGFADDDGDVEGSPMSMSPKCPGS
jgi:hypothetical protein